MTSELTNVRTITKLRGIESKATQKYWGRIRKNIPEWYGFNFRTSKTRGFTHPNNAQDYFNCLLNYGYAILQAEVLRCCNLIGLDPYYGFYHIHCRGKISLVYDLMERYRVLIDNTILENIGEFKQHHFILTNDGIIRLKTTGVDMYIPLLYKSLNSRTKFRGKQYRWTTVINEETREISKIIVQ